jgi:hypothetical protein
VILKLEAAPARLRQIQFNIKSTSRLIRSFFTTKHSRQAGIRMKRGLKSWFLQLNLKQIKAMGFLCKMFQSIGGTLASVVAHCHPRLSSGCR